MSTKLQLPNVRVITREEQKLINGGVFRVRCGVQTFPNMYTCELVCREQCVFEDLYDPD